MEEKEEKIVVERKKIQILHLCSMKCEYEMKTVRSLKV